MAERRISLLALPTEILAIIVRLCCQSRTTHHRCVWDDKDVYGCLRALCLASRRTRDVALPLLYEEVTISENPRKITAFFRHMQTTPYLARLVKRLKLSNKTHTPHRRVDTPISRSTWSSGGPLRLRSFQSLTHLSLAADMVPPDVLHFPTEGNQFPALLDCQLNYGWYDPYLPDREFQVSTFLPFWTAPNLLSFGIGGRRMHLIGAGCSDQYCNFKPPEGLADIENLTIGCHFDGSAISELMAVRKTVRFLYHAPTAAMADHDFNDCIDYLLPHMRDLVYLWIDGYSTAGSRYPLLSKITSVTSLDLSASSLAALSTESEIYEQPELRCTFPPFLEHLRILISPHGMHRRQFYDLVMNLVENKIPTLHSLHLKFDFAEIVPNQFGWNNRLVSQKERITRGIPLTTLYEANGQTAEHNQLRKVCERVNVTLSSEHLQMLPGNNRKLGASRYFEAWHRQAAIVARGAQLGSSRRPYLTVEFSPEQKFRGNTILEYPKQDLIERANAADPSSPSRQKLLQHMKEVGQSFSDTLEKYQIDVIIGPSDSFYSKYSAATGFPLFSLHIPLGYITNNGRPVGLTAISKEETTLVRLISAFEATIARRQPPKAVLDHKED